MTASDGVEAAVTIGSPMASLRPLRAAHAPVESSRKPAPLRSRGGAGFRLIGEQLAGPVSRTHSFAKTFFFFFGFSLNPSTKKVTFAHEAHPRVN
jgi:hypothetical protein